MITTGDTKLDGLIAELQKQIETLSEGKAIFAAEIAVLQSRLKELEKPKEVA